MNNLFEILSALAVFILFIVLPGIGVWYVVSLSEAAANKRDAMLKRVLPGVVSVQRSFPINQDIEEIIQGGLSRIIQSYRELIVGKGWLYIQPTNYYVPVFTTVEDRGFVTHSMFALQLDEFTPFIVIRNAGNRSFLVRYLQTKIRHHELVWCEGVFDADHNIYNEPGGHVDTLSILSPEVLEVLQNPPAKSDIILKRNQLYYILPGNQPAEKIVPELLKHSAAVARELNNNLHRWAQSAANRHKLEQIEQTELAVTLREEYERSR